jgi:hypothetical protein
VMLPPARPPAAGEEMHTFSCAVRLQGRNCNAGQKDGGQQGWCSCSHEPVLFVWGKLPLPLASPTDVVDYPCTPFCPTHQTTCFTENARCSSTCLACKLRLQCMLLEVGVRGYKEAADSSRSSHTMQLIAMYTRNRAAPAHLCSSCLPLSS